MNKDCPSEEHLSRFHDSEEIGPEAEHIRDCLECQRHLRELLELDEILLGPAPSAKKPSMAKAAIRRLSYVGLAVTVAALLWLALDSSPEQYQVSTRNGRLYTVSINADAQLLSLEVNKEEVMRNQK